MSLLDRAGINPDLPLFPDPMLPVQEHGLTPAPPPALPVVEGPPAPAGLKPAPAVAPAPPVLPRTLRFEAMYPSVPIESGSDIVRDGSGAPVLLRMNPTGVIRASWSTAWYKEQLTLCKSLGVDPYFWLAAQLLEFPGGYSPQKYRASATSLNNMSEKVCRQKLEAALLGKPADVAQLARVSYLEWLKTGVVGHAQQAAIDAEIARLEVGLDVTKMKPKDIADAKGVVSEAQMLSGQDLIDATGAASGCLLGDAIHQSGNLERIQRQLPALAAKYKVALIDSGAKASDGTSLMMIDPRPAGNRRAAYEQSFLLLRGHQAEIARALAKGTPPSLAFQRFNGMGERAYHLTDSAGTRRANGVTSPTYGATMVALMTAMRDPSNPQFAHIRQAVDETVGNAPERARLTVSAAAALGADPFARFFGSPEKLGGLSYVPVDRDSP